MKPRIDDQRTKEVQPTNEALLPPIMGAQAKCTYGEDTLRSTHHSDQNLSLDGSEL